MTGPTSNDTWFSRDLPFLQWVVPQVDANPFDGTTISAAAEALDWPREKAIAAARACENLYLAVEWGAGGKGRISDVSAAARQIAGLWPTPESIADRILHTAETMATDEALSEVERSRWQAIRDGALSAGRDVLVQLAAVAVGTHLPR